jgi:dihydrofolate reductase
MRLVVTAFMTLDGIVEAPGFDEHRDGRNAWALRVQDAEDEAYNEGQLQSADALLLGRRTWQIWAAFWPTATSPLAERLNRIPKYVVSNSLKRADWNNTTIVSGDVGRQVEALKAQPGGELVVYGSPGLVDQLLKDDLVDEYRLLVYPVILGSGKRMFRDRIDLHHLRLVRSRTFGSGVVLLSYEPESEAPTSRYVEDYAWTEQQVRSLEEVHDVDRVLVSILFTDVVDSTGRVAAMGDRAWKKLLDRHHEVVRAGVTRWEGRNLEFTGDGTMAVFDAPTRALRCAFGRPEGHRPRRPGRRAEGPPGRPRPSVRRGCTRAPGPPAAAHSAPARSPPTCRIPPTRDRGPTRRAAGDPPRRQGPPPSPAHPSHRAAPPGERAPCRRGAGGSRAARAPRPSRARG